MVLTTDTTTAIRTIMVIHITMDTIKMVTTLTQQLKPIAQHIQTVFLSEQLDLAVGTMEHGHFQINITQVLDLAVAHWALEVSLPKVTEWLARQTIISMAALLCLGTGVGTAVIHKMVTGRTFLRINMLDLLVTVWTKQLKVVTLERKTVVLATFAKRQAADL